MARTDQMEAVYELFGGVAGTYQSPCSIQGITTVVKGEPFDIPDRLMPVMTITIPKVVEYRSGGTSSIRGMAQKKGIDYTIRIMVGALLSGSTSTPQGPDLLLRFYGWLDAIGAVIRENKTLVTPSYPQGASVRFGEDSTWIEPHERDENTLKVLCGIETVSTELVNA